VGAVEGTVARSDDLPVSLALQKQDWRRRYCLSVKILAKFAGQLDTTRAFRSVS